MAVPKAMIRFFTVMITVLIAVQLQTVYAEVLDKNAIIARRDNNDGAKTYVLETKAKIAQEREAIIAAGKRLQDAKKTGDKTTIERVEKEVNQDIKNRKAVIRSLYDDINKKIGQRDSFIPGRKVRAKK